MFEFSTKEQREAWPIIREIMKQNFPIGEPRAHMESQIDSAAARFDAHEETCGIEPLSATHFVLGTIEAHPNSKITAGGAIARIPATLVEIGLLCSDGNWVLTDNGRAVLANLNKMCKVEK